MNFFHSEYNYIILKKIFFGVGGGGKEGGGLE